MHEEKLAGFRGKPRKKFHVELTDMDYSDFRIFIKGWGKSVKSEWQVTDNDLVLELPPNFKNEGRRLHVLQPGETLADKEVRAGDFALVITYPDG